MKRRLLLLVLPLLTAGFAQAQGDVPRHHEVTVDHMHLGVGSMLSESDFDWSRSADWSAGFGIHYTYWFNNHIGLSAGLSLTYLTHNEQLDDLATTSRGLAKLTNGTTTSWHTSVYGVATPRVSLSECYTLAEVPLRLSLRGYHLFTNVGVALAAPLTSYGSYSYSPSTYSLSYVEDLGISLDGVPIATYTAEGREDSYHPADVERMLFCVLTCEVGWRFYFDQRNMLSLSLYGNYGLNRRTFDYQAATIVNVDAAATISSSPLEAGLVDSYRYFSAGLCVAYHFGFGKSLK